MADAPIRKNRARDKRPLIIQDEMRKRSIQKKTLTQFVARFQTRYFILYSDRLVYMSKDGTDVRKLILYIHMYIIYIVHSILYIVQYTMHRNRYVYCTMYNIHTYFCALHIHIHHTFHLWIYCIYIYIYIHMYIMYIVHSILYIVQYTMHRNRYVYCTMYNIHTYFCALHIHIHHTFHLWIYRIQILFSKGNRAANYIAMCLKFTKVPC